MTAELVKKWLIARLFVADNFFYCRYFHVKHGQFISTTTACSYISKFKDSLEELNLQDCYWVKGGPLSIALQRCHKLKSLNVIGCEVSKKTICSILKLNENLKILEWSFSRNDLQTVASSLPGNQRNELLRTFCSELNQAFKKLECLTITFQTSRNPYFQNPTNSIMVSLINFGILIICSELCLKKFKLQWIEIKESSCCCFEIAVEGNGVLYKKISDNECMPLVYRLQDMLITALISQLNGGKVHSFIFPLWTSGTSLHHFFSVATKMDNVTSLTNINLGGFGVVGSAILSKQTLRYLNLAGLKFDGHLLHVVATSSPNLEVLNLHNCLCPELLQGLKALTICCPNLAKLNLHGVHWQALDEALPNAFMEVIAKFNHLVSLSICACMIGPARGTMNTSNSNNFSSTLSNSGKRVSHCAKLGSPMQNDSTPWQELSSESSFERMTRVCGKITDFELIRSSEHVLTSEKSYSYPVNNASRSCHSVTSVYDTLEAVANWTFLKRLTLSEPLMKGNLKFLLSITQNCQNLEFLSLALMANLGHSGNVVLLQQALSYCNRLRDFRLEQPNFGITESFLLALGELKHLERLCIIAKKGTMKIYSQAVFSLFEKCCKLYFFQVICDITVKASKALTDAVTQRFAQSRPGLVVSVVPIGETQGHCLRHEIAKSIPVVHFTEMFLFGTTVATKSPV